MGLSSILSAINPYAGLIGAGVSAFGQYRANKETKNFATRMSNTGYERTMADMRKAGLNPILAGRLGPASTPNYSAQNVASAGVQGYKDATAAKQMQVSTSIEKRTLDMLKRENVSMPEIQYTVKNIFGSKALRTIEAAMAGRPDQAPSGIYKSLAVKIQAMAMDAGILKGRTSSISGEQLGVFLADVAKEFGKAGLSGLTQTGKNILGALR